MKARGTALAFALLLVSACHSSTAPSSIGLVSPLPTATGPVIKRGSMTGTWRGWRQIESCTTPNSQCQAIGATEAFVLSVVDDPNSLAGVVGTFQSGLLPNITFIADVVGAPQPDGSVSFTGTIRPILGSRFYKDFSARLRVDGIVGLTGTMNFTYFADSTRGPAQHVTTIKSASHETLPLPPDTPGAFDPAGTWVGTGIIDSCPGCTGFPSTGPFSLTIKNDGGGMAALVSMDVYLDPIVVMLSGTRSPSGSVRFSGGSPPAPTTSNSVTSSAVNVTRLEIQLSSPSELTGTFEYILLKPTGVAQTVTGHMAALRRFTTFTPGNFEGAWGGRYIIRSCTGDCQGVNAVGEMKSFGIDLSQAGSSVSGWFGFPVAGTISSGGSSTIGGEHLVIPCPNNFFDTTTCTRRLINLSATVDAFSQMSGTIRYYEDGSSSNRFFNRTITGELWHVVREWSQQ